MKIFLAGGTGVVGTRALPALVAAGHDVTAVARSDAKADLVRSLGGDPVTVDLFDADAVRRRRRSATRSWSTWPPASRRSPRRRGASAWATNERLRQRGVEPPGRRRARRRRDVRYIQESIAFPYVDNGDRWIDEDHPVDHVGPFAGAARRRGRRRAASPSTGGTGVVLRFAQFYAPEAAHTIAFNTHGPAPAQPVRRRPRRLQLVHPRRGRGRRRSSPRCGRRAASTTSPTTSRSPGPRPAGSWPRRSA